MTGSEKLCEGNLSTSLLEGFSGSDAAQSDCENRTGADKKLKGFGFGQKRLESKVPGAGVVLESHENRLEQARTTHTLAQNNLCEF